MSIFEYDEEKEKELLRKAEYNNGVSHGVQLGIQQGLQRGIKDTIDILHDLGHEDLEICRIIKEKYALSDLEAAQYLQ